MSEVVIPNGVPAAADFKRAIAAYAREDARIALERNNSITTRQHAGLLEQLATLLEGLDDDSHELGALYDAQVNRGASPREHGFQPGPRAAKVLGNVGFTDANPKPAELLAELVRAAQADLISNKAAHAQQAADDAVRRLPSHAAHPRAATSKVSLRAVPAG